MNETSGRADLLGEADPTAGLLPGSLDLSTVIPAVQENRRSTARASRGCGRLGQAEKVAEYFERGLGVVLGELGQIGVRLQGA